MDFQRQDGRQVAELIGSRGKTEGAGETSRFFFSNVRNPFFCHNIGTGLGPKAPVRAQPSPSGCAPEAHNPAVCTRTYGGKVKQSPGLFDFA